MCACNAQKDQDSKKSSKLIWDIFLFIFMKKTLKETIKDSTFYSKCWTYILKILLQY